MRRPLFIATTSLTRAGVEACADFLEAVAPRLGAFWLPLPAELCKGLPADLGPLEKYLEPLLALYYEVKANWRCYGSVAELRRKELAAVKLVALVLKAKVFGKIDLAEWDTYFTQRAEAPPKPALAIGTLVQEDGIICGTYPPNPIELAHDRWHQLPPEKKSALAKWIVEYVSMIIESINLDEAYFKLVKRGWAHGYVNYIS
ncbi:hypothetical protein [Pyrobaculum arsenaticum]|uniref:Uncharacterized protein n=1 Tax=Pyrobaculum arsenaticum (strain DSM 13514 / JCM 11321 / PZ6) TaxID=340102 RepID=A4WKA7_PYRAR|nr:hypothetical protein [Pyrobaculum arsenaticum]ABP50824.1 conserved hypothetical protein [Pyrobaculum arsenaticum DSM 13514]